MANKAIRPSSMRRPRPGFSEVRASRCVSLGNLRKNPRAVIKAVEGAPVVIFSDDRTAAYLISPEIWHGIVDTFRNKKVAAKIRKVVTANGGELPAVLEML